jgi:hypothetical protein
VFGHLGCGRSFPEIIDDPTSGAPRIHGELSMLGFDISERTVLLWMWKAPMNPEPAKRWAAFLSNHREAITAMPAIRASTTIAEADCLATLLLLQLLLLFHRLRSRSL